MINELNSQVDNQQCGRTKTQRIQLQEDFRSPHLSRRRSDAILQTCILLRHSRFGNHRCRRRRRNGHHRNPVTAIVSSMSSTKFPPVIPHTSEPNMFRFDRFLTFSSLHRLLVSFLSCIIFFLVIIFRKVYEFFF